MTLASIHLASRGNRTWDALLTVLMASVSLFGQAKGSGRLQAPLGRMPTIRICILGAFRRMYAKMWRILGSAQQPVRRDRRCDTDAEGSHQSCLGQLSCP